MEFTNKKNTFKIESTQAAMLNDNYTIVKVLMKNIYKGYKSVNADKLIEKQITELDCKHSVLYHGRTEEDYFILVAKTRDIDIPLLEDTESGIEILKHGCILLDTPSRNAEKISNIKRLMKLLNCDYDQIEFCGYNKDIKKNSYNNGKANRFISKDNEALTKAEVLLSFHTKSLAVKAKESLVIIDVDSMNKEGECYKEEAPVELIEGLRNIPTFQVWNDKSMAYGNRKLIFKNNTNKKYKISKEMSNYVELLYSNNAILYTLEGFDNDYYDNDTIALNISDYETQLPWLETEYADIVNHEKNRVPTEYEYIEDKDIVKNALSRTLNKMCYYSNEELNRLVQIPKDKGFAILTGCPYCKATNAKRYRSKNMSDTYINVNSIKGKLSLHIEPSSSNCKSDNGHKEFFKAMNKTFKDFMPNAEAIQLNKVLCELKDIWAKAESLNVNIKTDNTFFIDRTLVIAGTGVGKSYQSVSKLLDNLMADRVTIISTVENSNLDSLAGEVIKIIGQNIEGIRTKEELIISDQLISIIEGETSLESIGIYKLTSANNDIKDKDIRAVLTNHNYFYNVGDMAKYNYNMHTLRDRIGADKIDLIIDEYESFGTKGITDIVLNEYLRQTTNPNDDIFYYVGSHSCLYNKTKDTIAEGDLYIVPTQNTKQNLSRGANGILKYRLNYKEGKINPYEDLQTWGYKVRGNAQFDWGKKQPTAIVKGSKYAFIAVDKLEQIDINIVEDGKKNNFRDLIKISEYVTLLTKVVKIGLKCKEGEVVDVRTFGEAFETPEELFAWAKENLTVNEFDQLKKLLEKSVEASLYHKVISVKIKSILGSFTGKQYYLTANNIRPKGMKVNADKAHLSSKILKTLNIVTMSKTNSIDKFLVDTLENYRNRPFRSVIFGGLKSTLDEQAKNDKIPDHVAYRIKEGDLDKNKKEDICDTKKNTVLTFANGKESQGKNYSNYEVLVVNAEIPLNVKGRVYENEHGDVLIKSYYQGVKERLIQIIGRILRGDFKLKNVLMIGDIEVISNALEYFKKYPFEINIMKNERKPRTTNHWITLHSEIIDTFEDYIIKVNRGIAETKIRDFMRNKLVENKNAKKNDNKEIYKLYKEAEAKYLKENPKKKGMSLRLASQIIRIPKNTINRALKNH